MRSRTANTIVRHLKKHRDKIAAERDKLIEIKAEIEATLEPLEEGIEALDVAISHFSEVA